MDFNSGNDKYRIEKENRNHKSIIARTLMSIMKSDDHFKDINNGSFEEYSHDRNRFSNRRA